MQLPMYYCSQDITRHVLKLECGGAASLLLKVRHCAHQRPLRQDFRRQEDSMRQLQSLYV